MMTPSSLEMRTTVDPQRFVLDTIRRSSTQQERANKAQKKNRNKSTPIQTRYKITTKKSRTLPYIISKIQRERRISNRITPSKASNVRHRHLNEFTEGVAPTRSGVGQATVVI